MYKFSLVMKESKRKNFLAQSIIGKLAVILIGRKVQEEISNLWKRLAAQKSLLSDLIGQTGEPGSK